MPTKFYFEIQYFNFYWKTTITLLHSKETLNSDKYSDVTATVGKTPPYRAVQNLKICRRKKGYS